MIRKKGVAIDPTCMNIGRLESTEANLIHFKWGSRLERTEPNLIQCILKGVVGSIDTLKKKTYLGSSVIFLLSCNLQATKKFGPPEENFH